MFKTQNPYNLEILKSYNYLTPERIEDKIASSSFAHQAWQQTSLRERRASLGRVAENLRKSAPELSRQMSLEMGKLISESLAELEKCAVSTEFIAENFEAWLESEEVEISGATHFIEKHSLGPIFCVMPWNFPVWQVMRFAIPNLAAGNTVLLKGSDICAGTSELLTSVFNESFPIKDVFENLNVDHEQAAKVIADPRVKAVTFTGSRRGGSEVAQTAGRHLKKVVLELGGSDAYLLLEDCDLVKAAKLCAQSRLLNAGQSCVSAKRFFVPKEKAAAFLVTFEEQIESRKTGDPLDPSTSLAPVAHVKFKKQLAEQVGKLQAQGSEVIWKSNLKGEGAFVSPVILNSPLNSRVAHEEELFGPIAQVFTYENLADAVKAINSSPMGLGAAIFSGDLVAARKLSQKIDVGMLTINDFIKSDARLPFGGVRESGFGRELHRFGFQEFLNLKTVQVKP